MVTIRRLFTARVGPTLFGASAVQPVLTAVGVFTFLAGALHLPSLGPTRVEMILALLLLAAVALLCTAVGQLAAILERLEALGGKHAEPGATADAGGA
jgi:drug/metabolite transporter (DMT)-like permease